MNNVLAITVLILLAFGGGPSTPRANDEDDVVERMLATEWRNLVLPTGADATTAIAALRNEQQRASGKRAQKVAFLLAALRSDYEKNRNLLVNALRGCASQPTLDCDEDTADFSLHFSSEATTHHSFRFWKRLTRATVRWRGYLATFTQR